ncbi:MAG: hypothetical protein AAF581_01480 [Planctomycetota bacterium]
MRHLCVLLLLLLQPLAALASSTCTSAVQIFDGIPVTGDLTGGWSAGSASCGSSNTNPDLWYVYNATCAGEVTISTCGTNDALGVDLGMDTVLSVYDSCGGNELACNDDDLDGWCGGEPGQLRDSAIRLPVNSGATLFIRVSHFAGAIANGQFSLQVSCAPVEAPVTNLMCSLGPGPDDYELTWDSPTAGTGADIWIFSSETGIPRQIASLSVTTESFAGSLSAPGASGQFSFCVEVRGSVGISQRECCMLRFNPPTNDECATAIVVSAPGDTVPFDNTLATTNSPSLPMGFCNQWLGPLAVHSDLWYEYTATTTGPMFASTCHRANFDTKIAVYEKSGCPALTSDLVTCNDDYTNCTGFTSRVDWTANAGTTYLVQVGGFDAGPTSRGSGAIIVSQEKPTVTNLNCSHGIAPGEIVVTFDYPTGNVTDEVRFYVNRGSGVPMYFGSVQHPATTFVGSLENPELFGTVEICAEAVGVGISEFECCTMTFSGLLNDGCFAPLIVGDGTPVAIGNLAPATPDGGTNCAPAAATRDAWYSYTAGCGGDVTFSTCGSFGLGGMDTVLSIHDGCPATAANEIGCNDDNPGACQGPIPVDSHVTVTLSAGQTVLVRVGHFPAPSGLGNGNFQLNIVPSLTQQPVTDLNGTDLGGGDYQLSFNLPAAPATDQVVVWSDEGGILHPVGFVVPPTSTFTATLSNANYIGDINFCAQAFGPCGDSTQVCTTVTFSGIPNDSCMSPIVLASPASGPVAFANTVATTSSPTITPSVCTHWLGNSSIERDLWYEYTATTAGAVVARSCGSSFDTKIAVYDGGACPPTSLVACNDDGCGLQSEVTFNVSAGASYLIQIGSFSPFGAGNGILEVEQACARVASLSGSFDCHTGSVSLWWTDQDLYTDIEVRANGTPLIAQPFPAGAGGHNSIQHLTPPSAEIFYEVIATCAAGGTSTTGIYIDAQQVLPSQDLVIALEGLHTAGELLGEIDSGTRLRDALEANGRSVALLRVTPRDYPCIADLLATAENVWLLLGTYPGTYALDVHLSGESAYFRDLVMVSGKNLYVEGGDHLGFNHIPGPLDDIDGIDLGGVEDGDDSFDSMLGQDAPTAGCLTATAFPATRTYRQDSLANDWTDRYQTAGPNDLMPDPGVTAAEVIWRNDGAGEPAYVTGVIATNALQRKVLTQSWEFGGFSDTLPPAQAELARKDLAAVYLTAFADGIPIFRRGDCNNDQVTNIADAVATLNHLFPSGCIPTSTCPTLPCESACDANDDGAINIADAITSLTILFPQGCVPGLTCPFYPAPGSNCGSEGTIDALHCDQYSCP